VYDIYLLITHFMDYIAYICVSDIISNASVSINILIAVCIAVLFLAQWLSNRLMLRFSSCWILYGFHTSVAGSMLKEKRSSSPSQWTRECCR